jgi:hypothetical protein
LVTVSRDPTVDQLAACLGLTLLLNKMGKHAAAIFSGNIPSTIEFLQPEETLERNTDSLRDFIIALDKSKADKLRYKVEDNVVRIFITPYRTSISEKDLEFSQGDFNVDIVVAIGVREQEDLDLAITSHGRILHDAVVASINLSADGGLGNINWHDPQASSLSELVTDLAQSMGNDLLDSQIATALLTGIVAATNRFSNDRTSSQTMNASARLMTAGANQQLVASKLEAMPPARNSANPSDSGRAKTATSSAAADSDAYKSPDGTLEIRHDHDGAGEPATPAHALEPAPMPYQEPQQPQPEFASLGKARVESLDELQLPTPQAKNEPTDSKPFTPPSEPESYRLMTPPPPNEHLTATGGLMTEAPTLGGVLTANTQPEGLDSVTDPLSLGGRGPGQLLDHNAMGSKSAVPEAQQPWQAPPPPPPSLPPEPVLTQHRHRPLLSLSISRWRRQFRRMITIPAQHHNLWLVHQMVKLWRTWSAPFAALT